MMKTYSRFVLIIIFLLAISCRKDNSPNVDLNCDNLKTGLINQDQSLVETEMSGLTQDLSPKPSSNDRFGHLQNFDILISRINKCQGITASMSCYCCIFTNPPQTELLIKIDSDGGQIEKILDFLTSDKSNLDYLGMH